MGYEVVRGEIIITDQLSVRIKTELAEQFPLTSGATLKEQVRHTMQLIGLEVLGIDSIQIFPVLADQSKRYLLKGNRGVRSPIREA